MTYNFSSPVGCNVTLPGSSHQSLCSAAEYITFMTALDAAIRSHPIISGNCERIKPIEEPDDENDFIVVGGGAGGAAVTGRLAEITNWKVLLLEAGEDESAAGQIPAFEGKLIGSEIDWNYYTSNESHACLSNNGSCYWSAAKSLGGNTAHSGIGPKEHLESKGIEVVLDLPGVGENLHDHVTIVLIATMNQTDTFENDIQAAEEYLLTQTGPISVVSNLFFAGAGETDKSTPDFPDVAIYFLGFVASCAPGAVGALRSNEKRKINAVVKCLYPKSKGRVSLASDDPLEQPVLLSNASNELHDREVILDSIEMALNLTNNKPEALREYDINLATAPLAACADYTFATRQYWDCAMQQKTGSLSHQVGTCKMGPVSDSMAVVDSKLRVHGIKHLRIADASVMPQVNFNTLANKVFLRELW